MNSVPLVSIVIPAFNPRFFGAALQSALGQSYDHLEVIVSDDCPTDDIRLAVAALSLPKTITLRYSRNPIRLGFAQNLMRGLADARGTYVKVLCDDDRLFPSCIAQQAKVLDEHSDVNLVLNQRFLSDENNFLLPTRLGNIQLSSVDLMFKGGDMLDFIGGNLVNILGNFSSALMRTSELRELMPLLTQQGRGFEALLDFALFVCLLRRGNMVMLSSVLSSERLHPERMSKQPEILRVAVTEREWLKEMLSVRGGEGAPAAGWARTTELSKVVQGQPHQWIELGLTTSLSNQINYFSAQVGADAESYAEFYADWLASRAFSSAELCSLPAKIAEWPSRPRIAIIITDPEGNREALKATLKSIEQQIYTAHSTFVLSHNVDSEHVSGVQYELLADNESDQLNDLLGGSISADWCYLLRSGDELASSALVILAERIAHKPGIRCVYSDEGALVDGVSAEPVFKPDFNLDLMRSYPYVGRTLAFACSAIRSAGGFDQRFNELSAHDLLWRLVEAEGTQVVEHIPEIQVVSSFSFAKWLSVPEIVDANRALLRAHLQRIGVASCVTAGELPIINRVEYISEQASLVSIIIDGVFALDVLQRCIETLVENTQGVAYEILIVAPRHPSPDMAQWLDAMGQLDSSLLCVLNLSDSGYGTAGMKNQAVRHARGDYLLFLSSGTVFFEPHWLAELLNHARRPEVGVVGGRILNAQGLILHVGLILGLGGIVDSPFVGESLEARGYMQRLLVNQNWSAVSGACMLMRREVFESLDGFDARSFSFILHDVDLCLRVGKAGYLVVGTPYSSVFLMQGSSSLAAPSDEDRHLQEMDAFQVRWLDIMAKDPCYNPNLSLVASNFNLHPGVKSGWQPFCSRSLPSVLGLPLNPSGSGHYRVIQPLIELEAVARVVGKSVLESPSMIEICRMQPDIIVLQCRYASNSPNYIRTLKKYSNAFLIFELDDYVLSAPKKNTHTRNKAENLREILAESIGLCDRVVVTTQALKEALVEFNDDIRVVPNMLAPYLWKDLKSERRTSSRPRVGWGGGTSHSGDLEIIAEVVRELANEVEWVFFGMCPEQLRPYLHEYHSGVNFAQYPAKLASLNLDLALAPLEFHIFNDCKSNLRLLEYGACGYPVICTDTRAYDGFLPCTRIKTNSTQEWIEAIRTHLADPDTSYRMGDQLREAVLQNFMLSGDNLRHWEWGWLPD